MPAVGMGTVVNAYGPMGILWRFSNGCEIKRNSVKHTIVVGILPKTLQFVICFTGIFSSLSLLNTHSNIVMCTA